MRIPPPPTSFVGREREVADVRTALRAASSLVTLRGPAGVGKTRLALEISRGEAGFFVDATAATDVTGFYAVVARALDVRSRSAGKLDDVKRAVERELANAGDVLLVLDNLEQIDGVSPEVERLRASAPAARVLATSRAPLGLAGETVLDVLPLALPEPGETDPKRIGEAPAVRLFFDRASASGASNEDLAQGGEALARVVRLLDGVPLAIELCAARAGLLGMKQLAVLLERDLLGSGLGARESSPRQATLRGALEWSWRLLGPAEREVLAQASVFRGGFRLDAAREVIAHEGDLLAVLEALHRCSLLTKSTGTESDDARFGLYESVRELAEEKLGEAGDPAKVEERHARYFVEAGTAWAEEANRRGGPAMRRRLADETQNLTAAATFWLKQREAGIEARGLALRALLALEPVIALRGPLEPYGQALDDALGALSGSAHPALARAILARTRVDISRGRLGESCPGMERAVEAARASGDRETEVLALAKLGALRVFSGDAAGEADLDRALELAASTGDEWLAAIVESDRASAASASGREKTAHSLRAYALDAFRRLGDEDRVGIVSGYLGAASLTLGRYEDARRQCEEALAALRAVGDRRAVGHVTGFLARAHARSGDPARALALFEEAIAEERAFGDAWYTGVFLGWRGDLAFERDELEAALEAYTSSSAHLLSVGEKGYRAVFLAASAAVEARLALSVRGVGLEGAAAHAREAEELARDVSPPLRAAVALHAAQVPAARARLANDVDGALAELRLARRAFEVARAPGIEGEPLVTVSDEVRFARDLLARAVGEREALFVGPEARWIKREGEEPVTLPRQRALRLLFLRLLEERERAPGRPVSREDLIVAAWPGERMRPEAAQNRFYVTLSRLKGLGLREMVRGEGGGGVMIDPEVAILRRS